MEQTKNNKESRSLVLYFDKDIYNYFLDMCFDNAGEDYNCLLGKKINVITPSEQLSFKEAKRKFLINYFLEKSMSTKITTNMNIYRNLGKISNRFQKLYKLLNNDVTDNELEEWLQLETNNSDIYAEGYRKISNIDQINVDEYKHNIIVTLDENQKYLFVTKLLEQLKEKELPYNIFIGEKVKNGCSVVINTNEENISEYIDICENIRDTYKIIPTTVERPLLFMELSDNLSYVQSSDINNAIIETPKRFHKWLYDGTKKYVRQLLNTEETDNLLLELYKEIVKKSFRGVGIKDLNYGFQNSKKIHISFNKDKNERLKEIYDSIALSSDVVKYRTQYLSLDVDVQFVSEALKSIISSKYPFVSLLFDSNYNSIVNPNTVAIINKVKEVEEPVDIDNIIAPNNDKFKNNIKDIMIRSIDEESSIKKAIFGEIKQSKGLKNHIEKNKFNNFVLEKTLKCLINKHDTLIKCSNYYTDEDIRIKEELIKFYNSIDWNEDTVDRNNIYDIYRIEKPVDEQYTNYSFPKSQYDYINHEENIHKFIISIKDENKYNFLMKLAQECSNKKVLFDVDCANVDNNGSSVIVNCNNKNLKFYYDTINNLMSKHPEYEDPNVISPSIFTYVRPNVRYYNSDDYPKSWELQTNLENKLNNIRYNKIYEYIKKELQDSPEFIDILKQFIEKDNKYCNGLNNFEDVARCMLDYYSSKDDNFEYQTSNQEKITIPKEYMQAIANKVISSNIFDNKSLKDYLGSTLDELFDEDLTKKKTIYDQYKTSSLKKVFSKILVKKKKNN